MDFIQLNNNTNLTLLHVKIMLLFVDTNSPILITNRILITKLCKGESF